MIAMALSTSPELIIADEPTTALDVTVQAQVLGYLRALCDEQGTSLLLVTHDLGVVAEVADRVTVMYAGKVVEEGTARDVFYDPDHPYTWGLLGSVPRLDSPKRRRLVGYSRSATVTCGDADRMCPATTLPSCARRLPRGATVGGLRPIITPSPRSVLAHP